MQGLKNLLKVKIAGTLVFWCIPLLALPSSMFVQLGFPPPEPLLFVRLLGAAYLTLLMGYYFGLRTLAAGTSPLPAIVTGIASNGLAFVILAFFGMTGGWSAWGTGAQVFMWLSTAGALFFVICLLYFKSHGIILTRNH